MMRDPDRLHRAGLAAFVWGVGWVAMLLLDRSVELGNLVLLPVLAAAVAGLWLSPGVSALVCVAAALAFNWAFVPPRAPSSSTSTSTSGCCWRCWRWHGTWPPWWRASARWPSASGA
jgi:K+-sensing histidine kinase KdpD